MPRLHGVRERLYVNHHDCWFYGSPTVVGGELGQRERLFGNKNIGTPALCSLQVPGQMGSETSFIVLNWYARAVLRTPSSPEAALVFNDMAHSVTCTLNVGSRSMRTQALSDLLRGGPINNPRYAPTRERTQDAARAIARECELDIDVADRVLDAIEASDRAVADTRAEAIAKASRVDVDVARRVCASWDPQPTTMPPPIIIPVRQNFDVRVEVHDGILPALRALVARLDREAEASAEGCRPAVWIHLEGLETRHLQ